MFGLIKRLLEHLERDKLEKERKEKAKNRMNTSFERVEEASRIWEMPFYEGVCLVDYAAQQNRIPSDYLIFNLETRIDRETGPNTNWTPPEKNPLNLTYEELGEYYLKECAARQHCEAVILGKKEILDMRTKDTRLTGIGVRKKDYVMPKPTEPYHRRRSQETPEPAGWRGTQPS